MIRRGPYGPSITSSSPMTDALIRSTSGDPGWVSTPGSLRGGRGLLVEPLEHRLEGVVDVAVAAVGVGVALLALGVGDVLVGLVVDEGGHGVGDAAVQPGADRGQDGGAGGGGLDAGRDADREAGDVGLDLAPQGALGAAADDGEAADLQAGVAHALQDVAQGVGAGLQQR